MTVARLIALHILTVPAGERERGSLNEHRATYFFLDAASEFRSEVRMKIEITDLNWSSIDSDTNVSVCCR